MAPQTKLYKLRSASTKDGKVISYSIAVPPEIGRALSDEMRFVCELTEDGILYRPGKDEPEPELAVPPWMKGSAEVTQAKDEVAQAWDGDEEKSGVPFN